MPRELTNIVECEIAIERDLDIEIYTAAMCGIVATGAILGAIVTLMLLVATLFGVAGEISMVIVFGMIAVVGGAGVAVVGGFFALPLLIVFNWSLETRVPATTLAKLSGGLAGYFASCGTLAPLGLFHVVGILFVAFLGQVGATIAVGRCLKAHLPVSPLPVIDTPYQFQTKHLFVLTAWMAAAVSLMGALSIDAYFLLGFVYYAMFQSLLLAADSIRRSMP